jgi:hypothetical protein
VDGASQNGKRTGSLGAIKIAEVLWPVKDYSFKTSPRMPGSTFLVVSHYGTLSTAFHVQLAIGSISINSKATNFSIVPASFFRTPLLISAVALAINVL